jgi:hypothetical protein
LANEELTVDAQEVLTFHTSLTRNRANEDTPVSALESFSRIAGRNDFIDERESAVFELHDNAVEGVHSRFDFKETKIYRLIGPQHSARSDAEKERVGDLPSSSSDGNGNRSFHNRDRAVVIFPLL